MAQRRMLSKKITDTDTFLDMPLSSQCLYFHLNMHADDDGFLGNSKTIRRMVGASEDDLKLLMAKELIIPFESGVVVIKDWKIHNYIRSDRYNPTIYELEKSALEEDSQGSYVLGMTSGIPMVDKMDTQVRLGKDRLGKERDIQSSSDELDDIPYKEIIDYLNEKTNSQFRNSTKKTQTLIKARFAEGFNLEDFKKVIDTKATEWLNDSKMSKFLRPETIFGTKFESYLNQKVVNNRTEYNPNAEIDEELGF